MSTTSKPAWPTATAMQHRLMLYQPTRRPALLDRIFETAWGKARVWGKLGQQHADVFDAICYCREKKADIAEGRVKLLVDPAKVRAKANQVSGSTFYKVVDELQTALIEIIEPEHLACSGHLIDHIDKAMRSDGTPVMVPNPLGGERYMWRVEIGKAFMRLVEADIWLGYDPEPLARLDHGISQAVARHVLTHKIEPNGGWSLDRLIQTVAGNLPEQQMRDRRRELRGDAPLLHGLGIVVEGERIHRVRRGRDGERG